MARRIKLLFTLPYSIKRDEGWYVASCDDLYVHSQGRTAKQATANLREALELFLTSALERGVLEQVLKEAGFVAKRATPAASKASQKYLDIPLHLAGGRGHAQARASYGVVGASRKRSALARGCGCSKPTAMHRLG